MTEKKLNEYFEGNITAGQLSIDLRDSQKRVSHDVISVYIEHMPDGGFEINTGHLIKLCNDFISLKLSSTDLNTIAFVLITSDFFHWDNDSKEGERIADVLYGWDNPEIGYDLSINNIKHWREYLLTGRSGFDSQELKSKFRNNRGKT